MAPTIPPLLTNCLELPEGSLLLLASVLGASTNWLTQRYIFNSLRPFTSNGEGEESKVLLVSFLRDLTFWKEGLRKLGIDWSKQVNNSRLVFVDGLTELFLPASKSAGSAQAVRDGVITLHGADLKKIYETIIFAIETLGQGRVVLVIDQLDLLLAAGGNTFSSNALGDMVMNLRQHVHSTILTLCTDAPLLVEQQTPLETNHASFVLCMAHQADLVLTLRLLDTGTARDVSGVLRITKGDAEEEDESGIGYDKIDKEVLYHVGGDGGVRVFERGT